MDSRRTWLKMLFGGLLGLLMPWRKAEARTAPLCSNEAAPFNGEPLDPLFGEKELFGGELKHGKVRISHQQAITRHNGFLIAGNTTFVVSHEDAEPPVVFARTFREP